MALTHFDAQGAAHMVDVGEKAETRRVARAAGRIVMQPATLALIRAGSAEEGRRARRRAASPRSRRAKRTADLIPLAHPIALTHVAAEFADDERESSGVADA